MKRVLLLSICSLMGFLHFANPLPRNATEYEGIISLNHFEFDLFFQFYILHFHAIRRYVLLAKIWPRESSKDPSSS